MGCFIWSHCPRCPSIYAPLTSFNICTVSWPSIIDSVTNLNAIVGNWFVIFWDSFGCSPCLFWGLDVKVMPRESKKHLGKEVYHLQFGQERRRLTTQQTTVSGEIWVYKYLLGLRSLNVSISQSGWYQTKVNDFLSNVRKCSGWINESKVTFFTRVWGDFMLCRAFVVCVVDLDLCLSPL